MFKYGEASPLLALRHGEHTKHLVLLGGLTDGMLYASYCEPLARAMEQHGWSTVHAQLSSSYQVCQECILLWSVLLAWLRPGPLPEQEHAWFYHTELPACYCNTALPARQSCTIQRSP